MLHLLHAAAGEMAGEEEEEEGGREGERWRDGEGRWMTLSVWCRSERGEREREKSFLFVDKGKKAAVVPSVHQGLWFSSFKNLYSLITKNKGFLLMNIFALRSIR